MHLNGMGSGPVHRLAAESALKTAEIMTCQWMLIDGLCSFEEGHTDSFGDPHALSDRNSV